MLVPFVTDQHWHLLAIDATFAKVYQLDSLNKPGDKALQEVRETGSEPLAILNSIGLLLGHFTFFDAMGARPSAGQTQVQGRKSQGE